MALLKSLMRTGIATKVMSEARKPKNQEKAKQLFHQAKGKFSGADSAAGNRTGSTGSAGSRDATGDAGSTGSAAQDGTGPAR